MLVWLCRDTVSEFHLRGGGGFKSVFDVADDYGCTRMLAVYDGSDPRSVEAVGTIRSELERREYRLRGENFRQVDVSKLNLFVSETLPEYMIPSVTMQIDSIPVNPNGKVDRRKLPEPTLHSHAEKEEPPADGV